MNITTHSDPTAQLFFCVRLNDLGVSFSAIK